MEMRVHASWALAYLAKWARWWNTETQVNPTPVRDHMGKPVGKLHPLRPFPRCYLARVSVKAGAFIFVADRSLMELKRTSTPPLSPYSLEVQDRQSHEGILV